MDGLLQEESTVGKNYRHPPGFSRQCNNCHLHGLIHGKLQLTAELIFHFSCRTISSHMKFYTEVYYIKQTINYKQFSHGLERKDRSPSLVSPSFNFTLSVCNNS